MKFLLSIFFISLTFYAEAQYKNSSKFLYGKQRSTLPYYIGVSAGFASNNFSLNKDFVDNGAAFSWGLSFEKLLGYRPSLVLNFRTMGRYNSYILDAGNTNVQALNTMMSIKHSFDLSLLYSYLFLDFRGWQYRAASGVAFSHNNIDVYDGNYKNVLAKSFAMPIQISTGRTVWKRFEIELSYRYYLAFNDVVDGIAFKNKYDKYTYTSIGLKYLIGEKDFRFQPKNSCPTVK